MTRQELKKRLSLDRLDKFMIVGYSIKAATGVAGSAVILEQEHPYLAIGILALGAISSEVTNYIKEKNG